MSDMITTDMVSLFENTLRSRDLVLSGRLSLPESSSDISRCYSDSVISHGERNQTYIANTTS